MTHRKVKNPKFSGFSHGHNWLTATMFQASDSSFCSSKRAEHTGKISARTKYCGASCESPQSRESRGARPRRSTTALDRGA
ncbi:hypothetical protein Ddc_03755 [Ditylenchus destructor]|nr:hypothetical protein Ddc_03755 [Ditylenchus destructor]